MRSTDNATVKLPSRSGNEWLQLRLRVSKQAAGSAVESGELAAGLALGLQAVELRFNGLRLFSVAEGTDDLSAAAAKSKLVDDAVAASLD